MELPDEIPDDQGEREKLFKRAVGSTDDIYKPKIPVRELTGDMRKLVFHMVDEMIKFLTEKSQVPEDMTAEEFREGFLDNIDEGLFKLGTNEAGELFWMIYFDGHYRSIEED